jgi:hypothetical protein
VLYFWFPKEHFPWEVSAFNSKKVCLGPAVVLATNCFEKGSGRRLSALGL